MIEDISKDIEELREELDMYLFYIQDIHNKPNSFGDTEIEQVEQLSRHIQAIAEVMKSNKKPTRGE